MLEDLAVLHAQLFERFQAVGDEAGGDDGEALDPGLGQALHRLVRIGLEPLVLAEARLEGDAKALGVDKP